ncbi:MAG: nuclear transport factor 2 family protein [Gammaproteobacteria bacterium]|nr:nuclear transport factor 2 family protein [Gammaproteobacteria bacterium]
MNIESRLRRVEAAEQIRLLKARYCDLCDQGYPADELCSLFTEDGIWDGGEMGVFEGRDALHRFFSNMPDIMSFAIHHVTNSAVEVNDDATGARGHWYLLQTATVKKTNQAVWLAARYEDDLVCTDGNWAFRRVNLKSRFYTTHEAGWANLPHLLKRS